MEDALDQIESLSDLELAVLLCLIVKENCLVETVDEAIDDLAEELRKIASKRFGLSSAVVTCKPDMSLEHFDERILDEGPRNGKDGPSSRFNDASLYFSSTRTTSRSLAKATNAALDDRRVVNVVIAKCLNLAPEAIQVQALELLRKRRIFGRTTVHSAPETFIFLPLISTSTKDIRLNKHLLDHLCFGHYHNPDEDFVHLQDRHEPDLDAVLFTNDTITDLQLRTQQIAISTEVKGYLRSVPVFLRLQHLVFSGISPKATIHLETLSKALAVIHRSNFVTPSLVSIAAHKVFPYHLVISSPGQERSLQYGSTLESIQLALQSTTPEDITNKALDSLQAPQ